jgi:3-hydroxybutyryl-CoA dehydrogenase
MKKIFISGKNEILRDELINLLGRNFTILDTLNESADIVFEITDYNRDIKFNNLASIEDTVSEDALIISTSNCITLLEQAVYLKHPSRAIGAGFYPTFSDLPVQAGAKGIELTKIHATGEIKFSDAVKIFQYLNLKPYTVCDRPGMIFLRILTLIINEAYLVLQEGTADAKDIDTAMKLGTNYPYGPLEWSEKIGIGLVYNLLKCMHEFYGEDRYRITPLLQEKYLAGLI